MTTSFHIRLMKNHEVLYESPEEGEIIHVDHDNDCRMTAQAVVDGINKLNLPIKARLVKDAKKTDS